MSIKYEINQSTVDKVEKESSAKLLIKTARKVAASAKLRAPVRTGYLRSSISTGTVDYIKGKSSSIEVSATAKYARFVHDGTKPHIIAAKNGKVLRFAWKGGPAELKAKDGFYYFKFVHHPGTKARPFLANALAEEASKAGFSVNVVTH